MSNLWNFTQSQKILLELTGYNYEKNNSYIINEIRNLDKEEYPSIFYIGGPKSASTSILEGFSEYKTAHWHDVSHVKRFHSSIADQINKPNDIFDLVRISSSLLYKKCLVVESYREPISRAVSLLFHDLLTGQLKNFDPFLKTENQFAFLDKFLYSFIKRCVNEMPYAKHWKDVAGGSCACISQFNNKDKFYYKECKYIKYLFLTYEHSYGWNDIFHTLGYKDYQLPKINISIGRTPHDPNFSQDQYNDLYINYTKQLRFDKQTLDYAFQNEFVQLFYEKSEIDDFYKHYQ